MSHDLDHWRSNHQQQNVASNSILGQMMYQGYTCPQCGAWIYGGNGHICTWWSQAPAAPQIGWKCPNCSRGNAPWMPHCDGCAPKRPEQVKP